MRSKGERGYFLVRGGCPNVGERVAHRELDCRRRSWDGICQRWRYEKFFDERVMGMG